MLCLTLNIFINSWTTNVLMLIYQMERPQHCSLHNEQILTNGPSSQLARNQKRAYLRFSCRLFKMAAKFYLKLSILPVNQHYYEQKTLN